MDEDAGQEARTARCGPGSKAGSNVASHLRRFVSPRLGKKIASEVTKHDIATLSNDIVAGRHGGKPSVGNARHMRRAASRRCSAGPPKRAATT